MYKEATKQQLRFATLKGTLSTEHLWDLSIDELNELAVSLDKTYNESGKKSFLVAKSVKDKTAKLRFDIVLDILTTKVEEAERLAAAKEDKAHNQEILGLIQEKEKDSLKSKSVKELKSLLRK